MNHRALLGGCSAFVLAATLARGDTHVSVGLRIGTPAPIVVREAPPPRVVERVYVSPGPGHVWIPGHYTLVENRWVWMTGAWALPPQSGAHWVDSRWDPASQQWTDAHWEAPVVVAPPPPPPVEATAVPPPSPPPSKGTRFVPTPSRPAPPVAGTPPQVIVTDSPPPPPPREIIVTSPGPGYVWITGYWGWIGGRREWIRGHWERPPHRQAVWVAPRWEHRGRNYVYIRGFWR